MSERKETAALSFEEAYRSLQEVVDRLERGNLPLEESVALFASGTELVQRCNELLDQAELKIKSLSREFVPAAGGTARSLPPGDNLEPTGTDDYYDDSDEDDEAQ
jgi:exodeoxyribonuclease VII small subunit